MFHGCSSLISLPDLYNLNISNLTNISYLFSECTLFEKISDGISEWETNNITDISHLFDECSSLKIIPNISKWKTSNVTNMSHLFYGCSSLLSIPDISNWNTNKVTDMSYMFHGCSSLRSLPNISNWKTDNVINMKSMFSSTSLLKSLPSINKWDIRNVNNLSYLFDDCYSLEQIPEINIWKTDKVIDISYFFCNCSSLEYIPDISLWNTKNIENMSYIFYGCSKLISMPRISKWNTGKVTDMSYMFYDCSSLEIFPLYLSNWNTKNVINMSYMFYNCSKLKQLFGISDWNTEKVIDITMMFYNCISLNPFPDISKWKCYNNKEIDQNLNNNNMNNEYKIEVQGPVGNDILKYIPQIELKFNNVEDFDINLMDEFKKEIKLLMKTDDFSFLEFKKGSLTVVIALQYIFINQLKKIKDNFYLSDALTAINSDVNTLSEQLKNHEFVSLGQAKPKPDYIDKEIIDITKEEYRKEISEKILNLAEKEKTNNKKDINFIEAAKTIQMEDLEKYFKRIRLEARTKESNIKRVFEKSKEYNKVFDIEIEKAYKESVLEYKIIHIFFVDKDDKLYKVEKNKCPNKIIKLLFHGTKVDSVTGILSTQFRHADCHIFGKGVYFTDILDYVWYYAGEKKRGNFQGIPKVGDTFSCVASEIYYDSTKLRKVYNVYTSEDPVEKNGIRCAFANYESRLLSLEELNRYKGFIGNEYLITDDSQYIPIYGITFIRVEYLVIWRDYNFDENNPNFFDELKFKEIQNFHREIKKYILRELDSKMYFIKTTEEALKLIDRKKYNKIIIISNGYNNGQDFIKKAREIIGSNAISAVSAYEISAHIDWVKNMENVLILNGLDLHKKFINCIKNQDKNMYNELKNEINNKYN